jgi:hypothetical protein
LVTRYDDIVHVERNPEIFRSAEIPSLLTRSMGNALLRKDGEAHRRERAAVEAPLRPRTVRDHWMPAFEKNTNDLINGFLDRGEADLFTEFAGPLAARNLALFLGLRGVTDGDLLEWSQAFIDGGGNYRDDPAVWSRCDRANEAVNDALDEVMPYLRQHPDESIVSAMMHADDPLTKDEIRANVKVVIGGGLNEPRDSIAVAIWALLTHPEQRRDIEADLTLWKRVFEEAVRWISPIGMYPRQVAVPTELGGVALSPGDRLGLVIASANRDERVFPDGDKFDIHRSATSHVAFGGGPHFCLGTWVARAAVGQVAVPTLFRRLPGLRQSDETPVRFGGWVFRGPLNLPAVWNT